MRTYVPYIFLGALLLSTAPCYAQFMPVVAKTREVEETSKDGKLLETHVREGVYYRSSDGSVLEYWTAIDGSPEKAKLSMGGNTFFDNTNGSSYTLDLQNHRAKLEDSGHPMQADSIRNRSDGKAYPEEWVSGVRCKVHPLKMRINIKGPGELFPAGQICVSPDYGLFLKREMTYPSADGGTEHVVWTIQNVEMGKEPDGKLFAEVRSMAAAQPGR